VAAVGPAPALFGKRLDHLADLLAHVLVADLVVGAHQLQRFPSLCSSPPPVALSLAGRFCVSQRTARAHLLEEERHRHIEHLGEFEEPAGAHAIGAALVLLDLLKGKAHGFAEVRLAHAQKRPALTHPSSNVNVHGMKPGQVGQVTSPS
jgi:hypothetical protein